MSEGLRGKTAIVTGASRGIGAAVAEELARSGADVVVAARHHDTLDKVVNQLDGRGHAVVTDIGKLQDLERLVKATVDKFGGVDILINNAAAAPPAKQIYNVTVDEWQDTMNMNVRSVWYLSKLCHPVMKERGGGAIVNISSTSGLHHDIGLGVYGISKAAVVMLTTVCAKEWARDKIRVNAIAPGIVRTELAQPVIDYIETHGQKPNIMNMIGEPDDIAHVVRFLVSDLSRYVTGDIIRVDGGELL